MNGMMSFKSLIAVITLAALGACGGGGDGSGNGPLSGRYVVFDSDATNLVALDTNAASDIFVHDTQAGVTARVSVDSAGAQGDGYSSSPDTK